MAKRREIFANLGIAPRQVANYYHRQAMAARDRRGGLKGMGVVRDAMDSAADQIDGEATAEDIAREAAYLIENFLENPEADDAWQTLSTAAALLIHALDEVAPPFAARPDAAQS